MLPPWCLAGVAPHGPTPAGSTREYKSYPSTVGFAGARQTSRIQATRPLLAGEIDGACHFIGKKRCAELVGKRCCFCGKHRMPYPRRSKLALRALGWHVVRPRHVASPESARLHRLCRGSLFANSVLTSTARWAMPSDVKHSEPSSASPYQETCAHGPALAAPPR